MKKFIIRFNSGYGDCYDEVEAKDIDEATDMAYQAWREAAEKEADYGAEPWTQEAADDLL